MIKELVFVSWGGIGDAIVCIPTYRELKKRNPDKKIYIYYPIKGHYDVFVNNPDIDVLKPLKLTSVLFKPRHLLTFLSMRFSKNRILNALQKYRVPFTHMHHNHVPITWAYEKSAVDIVADIFKFELTDRNIDIYLSEDENRQALQKIKEYKNVIIVHITSKSSKNRHWSLNKWSELVKSLPDYTFIQIGLKEEPHVSGAIDWRGKTTVREAFALLNCSTSFVGVDSSFAHATNAFNIPGVVLWGDSSPVHWGHSNNTNIYKDVVCSPCYYYLLGGKCPYNNICTTSISVQEVQEALIAQVEKKLHNLR